MHHAPLGCSSVSHVSACWLTGLGLGTPSKHLASTISWNAFKLLLLVCTTGAPPQITGSKCGPIRWGPALLTKIRNQDLVEITYIVNPLRPPPTLRSPPPPPPPLSLESQTTCQGYVLQKNAWKQCSIGGQQGYLFGRVGGV